ncbi:hypothetical protein [Armatimonas sp.]|uniref:hypothetical protein n=1 Tax=Armatimonas sp. TaxID=1872638 RepID=UPI00375010CC
MPDSSTIPEEVTDFDTLLDAASDRIEAETATLRERNRRLESLLTEKTALVQSLETTWKTAQHRRKRIDAEIARLLQAA